MSKTVLVIDDAEAIRKSVGFTLQEEGFNIIEAVDGVDALKKLKKNEVDLILCDVNMPKMDGIEFLGKLKNEEEYSQFRFTPILMLTTEAGKDKKEEGKKLGAKAWIVKPFKPDKLIKAVQTLIS